MQWHFTKRIHLQSGHFQSVLGSKKEPKKEKVKMGSRMMDPVRKIYIGGLPNNANKYDIEVSMYFHCNMRRSKHEMIFQENIIY